jgi:hypothetical protein
MFSLGSQRFRKIFLSRRVRVVFTATSNRAVQTTSCLFSRFQENALFDRGRALVYYNIVLPQVQISECRLRISNRTSSRFSEQR